MVIQRIQTLFLLLSAILIGVFAFLPALTIQSLGTTYQLGAIYSGDGVSTKPDLLLLSLSGLIFVLSVIAIFKYKNLKQQMQLCAINIVLSLALLLSVAALAFALKTPTAVVEIGIGNLLPLLSIISFAFAYRGIKHDKKLLSDSNRIR